MTEFFTSGRAVDVVLLVLLVEALWLKWRGHSWTKILAMLMPAAMLLIALRNALTGMAWPFIAIPLAAAFPVHLLDLWERRKSGEHPPE